MHAFALIWIFSVPEKLQSGCLIGTSQSSKYCSAKDISKSLPFLSSVKASGGIRWNF